jgi:hypothetical protein
MRIRQKIAEAKEAVETVKGTYQIAIAALIIAVLALLVTIGRGARAV